MRLGREGEMIIHIIDKTPLRVVHVIWLAIYSSEMHVCNVPLFSGPHGPFAKASLLVAA